MYDTPTSPSPASFRRRVEAIAAEMRELGGPHNVMVLGRPAYFSNEADATRARLLEAERRTRNECRFEGALRTRLAELEGFAVRRGRSLQQRGLSDDALPSLDCMAATNSVIRLVEQMARRLAQLERDAERHVERFEITPEGRRALAEPQEMAS